MAFVSDALSYGGLFLEAVAILLLVSGPLSRYFPVFLYLLTSFAVTASLAWVYSTRGVADPLYFNLYWGGEIMIDLLLFILVISLTTKALEGNPAKPKVVRLLTIVLVAVLVLPFVLFQSKIFGRSWYESVGQLLNFGAAVMNLALWSALILSRQRDRQLLTVSAGLGVTVAAAAVTLGVRKLTDQDDVMRTITDATYRISQVACPLIWCWAFRPPKKNQPAVPPPVGATSSAN